MKLKLRNLRLFPAVRLVRSGRLDHPPGHRRAELSISGMVCAL